MKRLNRFDYDDCMSTLERHAGNLTDAEKVSLNIVAGNYVCNEMVTPGEYYEARDLVAKMSRREPTPIGPAHTI